jgi:tRNA threonylcarbamoyladenosine biosynthesis protein TsaB
MNVLAIESSGLTGSVAACRDGELLAESTLERGAEHGRGLVPLVDDVTRRAGWARGAGVDLVVISQGPGSFTGLRVGIVCAKTMAVLLNKPIVGVCSLDAMAENAPSSAGRIVTALDAKRGQVYYAQYERADDGLRRLTGPALGTPQQSLAGLRAPVCVLGDALRHHAEAYAGTQATPEELWRIRAAVVARLGLAAFQSGRSDEPFAMQPTYIRLAEAEERRLAREGKGQP